MAENNGTVAVTLKNALEAAMPKLMEVAPKYMKVERIVRILLSACSRNPRLMECSRDSVLTFCMKCAETGLEPIGPGGAWPVPYRNKKTGATEMQFIPDYRGLVNCAKRANCITDAYAEVVKENDEFDYTLGMTPQLTHKPAVKDRGALCNAYCVFRLPDGTQRFVVMDAEEIDGIRKRSRASDDGPWVTDESEMWKKTVVRRSMKPFAGMSAELDAAIDADNAATGLVQKEPISMPRKKELPENTETPPAPAADAPPAEGSWTASVEEGAKLDRDACIEEIKVLVENGKAKDVHAAMKGAGIAYDEGEAWEKADDKQLTTLRSLLKGKK